MALNNDYLMENPDEILRLETKTDPESLRKQAIWCGIKPGMRVLDVGCGSGKVSSILHEFVQPGGEVLGVDSSVERIAYAKRRYGNGFSINFLVHDLRSPLDGVGRFDLIWVRFILEYFRRESPDIVKNLTTFLKSDGYLCLLDLDHNCLNHYQLPLKIEQLLNQFIKKLEQEYNFDPYSGRKLYAYLYDLGFRKIELKLIAHHLLYGEIKDEDIFNWFKKVEISSAKIERVFRNYPGGRGGFFSDFKEFFLDPRRFTYTPLILCKGMKPLSS
ncbi:MAG: class I SAM-dependent methyltransferase [Desulfobacterales bacterium]